MNKFLVTYHSTPEQREQMKDVTPEQMAEMMKPWGVWAANVGDSLVEMGAPIGRTSAVTSAGLVAKDDASISGYSLIQAESFEDAMKIMEGNPINTSGNGSIEIHECGGM